MSVNSDSLLRLCNIVGGQVKESSRSLEMHCILHHSGQRDEAVALDEHDILQHPAGQHARNLLRRKIESERSVFLGLASASERVWFGFGSRSHVLALMTLNADDFDDPKEAKRHLYHLAWHALDLSDVRERPEYKSKFLNGPMIPRRSPMNQAKANLRADVFSAVMMSLQGDKDAIRNLAVERSISALTPTPSVRAEDYPYIIAMEATQFALREAGRSQVSKNRQIRLARQIADEVGRTFEDISISQWWGFSRPAQDMAWRGHSMEEILGAAINTCEDPYVRATGLLVYEILGISPASGASLAGIYNAYSDDELNARLHKEAVDEAFEDVVAQGLFENSCDPFIAAANQQNAHLTEGKIIGWCAHALQAAGKAFESALASGGSPSQAARREFEGEREKTDWNTVRKLGDKIIEQRRHGYAVTFSDLVELCRDSADFAVIRASVQNTLDDPALQAKLAAAADLSLGTGPAPAAAAPKAAPRVAGPAQATPEYLHGPALGGSAGSARATRPQTSPTPTEPAKPASGEEKTKE